MYIDGWCSETHIECSCGKLIYKRIISQSCHFGGENINTRLGFQSYGETGSHRTGFVLHQWIMSNCSGKHRINCSDHISKQTSLKIRKMTDLRKCMRVRAM